MSDHKITIPIRCSGRTCTDDGDHNCKFLGYYPEPFCVLFMKELSSDDQRHNGQAERCRQCLDAEQP